MSAKRLGAANVLVTCLECSYDEMPAEKEEVKQAEEEGIKIDMSWGPRQILTSGGKVTGVELKRCTTCYDKSGKFAPKYDENEVKKVEADMVITAIGQASDLSFLNGSSDYEVTPRGTFVVDPATLSTNVEGVFAAGDIQRGAGLMIEAMADGRRAATAIDAYLQGVPMPADPPQGKIADIKDTIFAFHLREEPKEDRYPIAVTPVAERKGDTEINLGFADKETCIKEARRCLTCRCTSIRY